MEEDNSMYDFKLPTTCNLNLPKLNGIAEATKDTNAKTKVNMAIVAMPTAPNTLTVQFKKRYEPQQCIDAINSVEVPANFTWRTFGQDQVEKGGARNQAQCGGCWAFALAGALGDRFALENQLQAPYISTASMISFGSLIIPDRSGCRGNNVFFACDWLGNNDIYLLLEKCWPYSIISQSAKYGAESDNLAPMPFVEAGNSEEDKEIGTWTHFKSKTKDCCYNCCGDMVKDIRQVRIRAYPEIDQGIYHIKYFGVDNLALPDGQYTQKDIDLVIKDIQTNILTYGPVTTSILVYRDFEEYWNKDASSGKIYNRINSPDNDLIGGHAMIIVGWGQDDKTGERYWEIRNSWGDSGWEHGYCKIGFSTLNNQDQWIGVDIPLYDRDSNNYNCGVVSVSPKPLHPENELENAIKQGVLKKSSAGNLLEKSRQLIKGFNKVIDGCVNFNSEFKTKQGTLSPTKSGRGLALIVISVIVLVLLILGFLFWKKK